MGFKNRGTGRASANVTEREDECPEKSPYLQHACSLAIGASGQEYSVPEVYLKPYPQWSARGSYNTWRGRTINLPEVEEEVGHTLVHYLYTGTYQTLRQVGPSERAKDEIEYKRALLVYRAATVYAVGGLAELATTTAERHAGHLSISQIMGVLGAIYSKFPTEDEWMQDHVRTQIQHAYASDQGIFTHPTFLHHIGNEPIFSKRLVEIMVGTYERELAARPQHTCQLAQPIVSEMRGSGPIPLSPSPARADDLQMRTGSLMDELAGGSPARTSSQKGRDDHCCLQTVSPARRDDTRQITDASMESDITGRRSPVLSQNVESRDYILKVADKETVEQGLRLLAGLVVKKHGHVVDGHSHVVGRLVQGNPKQLSRQKATCDGEGNVWHAGTIVGKVERVRVNASDGRADGTIPCVALTSLGSSERGDEAVHALEAFSPPADCDAEWAVI